MHGRRRDRKPAVIAISPATHSRVLCDPRLANSEKPGCAPFPRLAWWLRISIIHSVFLREVVNPIDKRIFASPGPR